MFGFGIGYSLMWLISLAAFIWVLYDVLAVQKGMSTGKKVLWIVLAFFFSIITAIVYYIVVKK